MEKYCEKKNMKLSLHSAQYFLPFGDLFDGDGLDKTVLDKLFAETVGDPILVKYKCDATFTDNGEICSLRYTEVKTEELSGAETTIVFSKDKSESVSVVRRAFSAAQTLSNAENAFLLDPTMGYETTYSTEMGDFTMRCICGKIKNTLSTDGGMLILDYISQLEGFDPQRIKMRVEINPSNVGGERFE